MRKEVWYAIAGGIILGFVIGFGVYRINFTLKKEESVVSSPTPNPVDKSGLTIAKPDYDDVITSLPFTLSGITTKNSWVIISDSIKDYIFKSDDKGVFEKNLDLEGGTNLLLVSQATKEGEVFSQELRLLYSTQMNSAELKTEITSSESGVRESVLKKVEEAMNNPKAYLGTVTDISEGNIQLKSDSGSIEQVSTKDEEITVVKTIPQSKEVKIADIAIGDYIAAMGFKNGNSVLNAKRILISTPSDFPQIKIISGKVKSISKKEIVVNEEEKAAITTATKLSDKNIKTEDNVIVVATTIKDVLTARTIFLVESTP